MAKHTTTTKPATTNATQAAQAAPQAAPAAPVQGTPANAALAAVQAALAQHVANPAGRARGTQVPHLANSTIVGPVRAVHVACAAALAISPNLGRGALVAMCVQQGIATATAQTQVSRYLTLARKAAAAAAAAPQAAQ